MSPEPKEKVAVANSGERHSKTQRKYREQLISVFQDIDFIYILETYSCFTFV